MFVLEIQSFDFTNASYFRPGIYREFISSNLYGWIKSVSAIHNILFYSEILHINYSNALKKLSLMLSFMLFN